MHSVGIKYFGFKSCEIDKMENKKRREGLLYQQVEIGCDNKV